MLNRRHLRVKVLQELYAYHQSESKEILPFQKSLLASVDRVYELYIWMLSLLVEVAEYSARDAAERANKFLPTEDDLNASNKLEQNAFIRSLKANTEFNTLIKKYKISWAFDPEVAKSVFAQLKTAPEYTDYLQQQDNSIKTDKDIIKYIFKKIILKSASVEQIFEEKFINWPVDKEILQALIAKTFKNFTSEDHRENKLAQLCPNWEEDREFIINLFNKTIAFDDEYQEMIAQKTQNWEAERIAMMDTLLMKLAIVELIHFPSIPVKVTMNEYIEISKEFSTPKSNSFINGILDKILAEQKSAGKIRKFGRGLIG